MFSSQTFEFLAELKANNRRDWFVANQTRYEALVREPALEFIAAMAPQLTRFAPHFRAEAKKAGGSLMRVFRDTRFACDKSPYKTNVGIHFRHALGKDVHAPGYYVHLAADGCFLGVGCWHPEPVALGRLREAIAERPEQWFKARNDPRFAASFALSGDSLTRLPRGYAADHPAREDLKRKDFIAIAPLAFDEVVASELPAIVAQRFTAATPLVAFLCSALGVPA